MKTHSSIPMASAAWSQHWESGSLLELYLICRHFFNFFVIFVFFHDVTPPLHFLHLRSRLWFRWNTFVEQVVLFGMSLGINGFDYKIVAPNTWDKEFKVHASKPFKDKVLLCGKIQHLHPFTAPGSCASVEPSWWLQCALTDVPSRRGCDPQTPYKACSGRDWE